MPLHTKIALTTLALCSTLAAAFLFNAHFALQSWQTINPHPLLLNSMKKPTPYPQRLIHLVANRVEHASSLHYTLYDNFNLPLLYAHNQPEQHVVLTRVRCTPASVLDNSFPYNPRYRSVLATIQPKLDSTAYAVVPWSKALLLQTPTQSASQTLLAAPSPSLFPIAHPSTESTSFEDKITFNEKNPEKTALLSKLFSTQCPTVSEHPLEHAPLIMALEPLMTKPTGSIPLGPLSFKSAPSSASASAPASASAVESSSTLTGALAFSSPTEFAQAAATLNSILGNSSVRTLEDFRGSFTYNWRLTFKYEIASNHNLWHFTVVSAHIPQAPQPYSLSLQITKNAPTPSSAPPASTPSYTPKKPHSTS